MDLKVTISTAHKNNTANALPEAFYYRNPTPIGDNLPLRHLNNVSIFDSKGEYVSIEKIERLGPFSATGVPSERGNGIVTTSESVRFIRLENITEYSLEYPYGKSAIIWLQTKRAYYSVDSLSREYEESGKGGLFRDATVCGNVINAFINIPREKRTFARVMFKAMWLSRLETKPFFDVITARRQFLLDQFSQQNLVNFTQTRVYRILGDHDHWTRSRVGELMLLVEREAAKQNKHPDLISSDEESDNGSGSDKEQHENKSSNRPTKKIRLEVDKAVLKNISKPESTICNEIETTHCSFSLQPNTMNIINIEMPTEMALHYNCPFCQLTLRRSDERLSIVQLAIDHFTLHSTTGRFLEPVEVFKCLKWPGMDDTADCPLKRTILCPFRIIITPHELPICIV